MEAKEFVIRRFESNNPELLKSIKEWEEFSIKQNYEGVHILLNENNIPKCPSETEYGIINDKGERGNLLHYHIRKITAEVVEYLTALGFSEIHTLYPNTEITPNNTYQSGFLIIAKL